jgi:hypothetical protein
MAKIKNYTFMTQRMSPLKSRGVKLRTEKPATTRIHLVIKPPLLLVFLYRDDKRADIVSSCFVVLHMRSITQRERATQPAATIDFLSFFNFVLKNGVCVVKS